MKDEDVSIMFLGIFLGFFISGIFFLIMRSYDNILENELINDICSELTEGKAIDFEIIYEDEEQKLKCILPNSPSSRVIIGEGTIE